MSEQRMEGKGETWLGVALGVRNGQFFFIYTEKKATLKTKNIEIK